MYLSDLALSDFRSYERALLSLEPGITTFVGENGQGKTNIVEAIAYLATLSSHRTAQDSALIRQGKEAAVIQARVLHGERPTTIEVEIYAGHANRARVNRAAVRPPEVLGNLRAVVFAPEDLELVRADPGIRRRFLDAVMIQLHPRLAGVSAEYDKVTRQRAAVLKAASAARRRGRSVDHGAIDVWDAQIAKLGSQITAARAGIISGLRPHVTHFYNVVSGDRGLARIDYKANASRGIFSLPSALELHEDPAISDSVSAHEAVLASAPQVEEIMLAAMEERRDQEIDRGVNLVGPHRDEVVLSLGTLPAKGFASHGESWSYALALRLGAWQFLREQESGDWDGDGEPILILDDVFAELDSRRRMRLAEVVADAGQVFVTAAVGDDLPEELSGKRFFVENGEISSEESEAGL